MKPGQTLELAVWLTGTETLDMVEQWRTDCRHMMARSCGPDVIAKLSDVRFLVKRPGDERVPSVPEHVLGPDVRLLIAEADVVGFMPLAAQPSFIDDLDKIDLTRLRMWTREAAGQQLTDDQCDAIIRELGPAIAVKSLKAGVDRRVH